jgi:lipopolysaccharide biosynthesis glycosyltransferase
MGVSAISLAVNNPEIRLRIHVFASSISEEDAAHLESIPERYPQVEIHLYDVDAGRLSSLPTLERYPLAIYFRLMMPVVLPEAGRLLYLDSDILCLGSLEPLLDLPMDGWISAAAPDAERTAKRRILALGMASGAYFNSGVMLLNVRKWNEERITQRTVEMLAATPERFLLPDQDVLNLLLEGHTHYLPRTWNTMLSGDESLEGVHLLHCAAHPKPWRVACSSRVQPIYLKYEDLSPWKGMPLEQPVDYREARWYARALLRKGRFIKGLGWYLRAGGMKFQKKVIRRLLG